MPNGARRVSGNWVIPNEIGNELGNIVGVIQKMENTRRSTYDIVGRQTRHKPDKRDFKGIRNGPKVPSAPPHGQGAELSAELCKKHFSLSSKSTLAEVGLEKKKDGIKILLFRTGMVTQQNSNGDLTHRFIFYINIDVDYIWNLL
jgi:hypothetical protein